MAQPEPPVPTWIFLVTQSFEISITAISPPFICPDDTYAYLPSDLTARSLGQPPRSRPNETPF